MHLGNEIGMNLHKITADDLVMIADMHAFTGPDKSKVPEWATILTAQFLAIGCKGVIYRQSDIPELLQLKWLLANIIGSGHIERMHAWKACNGDGSVGLYTYPILMAADIILPNARYIRVGRDQLQHIEIARVLAERASREYGFDLVVPEAILSDAPELPGLDGRKMSKSYNNTIPLICSRDELWSLVSKVKTNSALPNEPKERETLFQIYSAFASLKETESLKKRYVSGISWREVKEIVFEKLWGRIGQRKVEIDEAEVREVWRKGASAVREQASRTLAQMAKVYYGSVVNESVANLYRLDR